MARIVAQTFATLDGVVDAPAEPTYLPFTDAEVEERTLALLESAGALLLGRKTFQGLAAAWRPQTGKFADRMNALPKYVVSTTLQRADEWEHSTLIGLEQIAGLKEEVGGEIVSYGCGRLARTLVELGLLDELQLWIVPVVAGSGARLFGSGGAIELRLAETAAFPIGTALLRYEPAASGPRSTA